jgi:hypothetical protein
MAENLEPRKDFGPFLAFLNNVKALEKEGLPHFLEDDGNIHYLFYTVLPFVYSRYLATPDQITAKQLGHLYATVKNCLEERVLMDAEDESLTNEGSWWADLKTALKSFASAYEAFASNT